LISVIVPSYNESKNIELLAKKIFNILNNNRIDGELIIVDDNSPDGTAKIASLMKNKYPALKVIIRKKKRGLSSAIAEGFRMANGKILVAMDADMSHPTESIPELIKPIERGTHEVVMGTRYLKGGGIEGWTFWRLVTSKWCAFFGKVIFGLSDPFSGFFAIKKSVIENIDLSCRGFKIGIEIIMKARPKKIAEMPYMFKSRKYGKSKFTGKIMWQNALHFFLLIFKGRTRQIVTNDKII